MICPACDARFDVDCDGGTHLMSAPQFATLRREHAAMREAIARVDERMLAALLAADRATGFMASSETLETGLRDCMDIISEARRALAVVGKGE